MLWMASLLSGLVIFLFGAAMDWLVFGRFGRPVIALTISNALSGVLAFAIAAVMLRAERHKRQQIEKRLAVLDDVNDQVRNTLQGMAFLRVDDARSAGELQQAITRIRSVLTEVLPRVEPSYQPFEGSARAAGIGSTSIPSREARDGDRAQSGRTTLHV